MATGWLLDFQGLRNLEGLKNYDIETKKCSLSLCRNLKLLAVSLEELG